jgi:hypothetical protein
VVKLQDYTYIKLYLKIIGTIYVLNYSIKNSLSLSLSDVALVDLLLWYHVTSDVALANLLLCYQDISDVALVDLLLWYYDTSDVVLID